MRALFLVAVAGLGMGHAEAAIVTYTYQGGPIDFCSYEPDVGCNLLAPVTGSFSIDTDLLPMSLAGATIDISAWAQKPDYTSFAAKGTVSGVGHSYNFETSLLDARQNVLPSIGILIGSYPYSTLPFQALSEPALDTTFRMTFGASGEVLNWGISQTWGGTSDAGSSGPNGAGIEGTYGDTWTVPTGVWSGQLPPSPVPVPASAALLAAGVATLAFLRGRRTV